MNTLTDSELAQIRSDIESLTMPDTCTVLTLTDTPDGAGGVSQALGTAYANVPFRLDAHKGYEAVQGGEALRPYQEFIGSLPQSYAVTTAHRILHSGVTYNVIAVNAGSWLGVKRVVLEKL